MKGTERDPDRARRAWPVALAMLAALTAGAVWVATAGLERRDGRARPGAPPPVESARVGSSPAGPVGAAGVGAQGPGAPAAAASGLPAAPRPPPAPAFFATWGSRDDQLGRDRPEEGNPMGPTSVAVDTAGHAHVLDSVNRRVVRRDAQGRVVSTLNVDLRAPEDVVVARDGTVAVLDRLGDEEVAVYGADGKLRGKLPTKGEGIPDPGEVTGLFADGADLYVERRHGKLVKIGDTRGAAAEPRTELAGRPSRDGALLLTAAIVDANAGRLEVVAVERATGVARFRRELKLWPFVRAILLLDTDAAGVVYFAAELQRGNTTPSVVLSCLEPATGAVVGGAVLPANVLPEESLRDFAVLDQGGVLHALRTEQGVSYTRWTCEGA